MKCFLSAIIVISLMCVPVYSQFNVFKKKLEKTIEKEIEKELEEPEKEEEEKEEQKADSLDKKRRERLEQRKEEKRVQDKKDNQTSSTQPSAEINLQSYSKYDFIPGEKIIFFDDFSNDAVGDFPALWNTNGSAEVVTTSLFPGKWLKFICREAIWTDNLLDLPENYTIEFDVIPINNEDNSMDGYNFRLIQSKNLKSFDGGAIPGKAGFGYFVEYFGRPSYRTYVNSSEDEDLGLSGHKDDKDMYQKVNVKYHIALWVQKSRVRLYQNENKLFDLPKAFSAKGIKMDRIRFENGAALVSNIRIAVGAPDMRSKLITEGKLVSYGIYFDINKDILKPESYSTLKTIADVLKENPTIRVKITGHTDGDGSEEANLDLSARRGECVKKELIKSFGIDPSRLESGGEGESKPIAPNDTPSNKALNRRVEFLKL